jgi:hypothetical protein
MNVRFIHAEPRQKARPELDKLLMFGTDQIAVACAFITSGGVKLLKPHEARLTLPRSFVVVAWDEPTSLDALNELYEIMPGNLYVHLGCLTPVEIGVGPGLMHSKVFLARGGNECKLWTGSHNLTASAIQGVNCEAAVVVEGNCNEQVFLDALAHLNKCRDEAILFDPLNPPGRRRGEMTLIIHAECHTTLKNVPWFVHFRPGSTIYDRLMSPGGRVYLFLYEPGSLRFGFPRPPAKSAHSGTITALNYTETHPGHQGIPADWQKADYIIELKDGVPSLLLPTPHAETPSQSVFSIDQEEDPNAIWLSESPTPKLERVLGESGFFNVDEEFQRFFTRESRQGLRALVHKPYQSLEFTTHLLANEVGSQGKEALRKRIPLGPRTKLLVEDTTRPNDRFVFIYRARFRV